MSRHTWRVFRRRIDELRQRPILDYGICRSTGGGEFRFTGGFESVTDSHTLWVRSGALTIPVSLAGAWTWLLPMQEGFPEAFDPAEETPERIRWNRISALNEGAKVFVGGELALRDNRWTFVSTRENPLLVIFYDGPDHSLTARAIRAGRHRNEYWNTLTPYALALGALCEIFIAVNFLYRPAFRLTVITSLTAILIPLFPFVPPGVLFTLAYRRLWRRGRVFRAYRDLVRLPFRYLPGGEGRCRLPGGEWYGSCRLETLSDGMRERIPLLIPEREQKKNDGWYVYGALDGPEEGGEVPHEPLDPFATFGAVPGSPAVLARRYNFTAYALETVSWILLLAGIGLNVFFVRMIFVLFLAAL
ncbi:MAG: hypothetical protein LBK08_12555 [Treponema sp.]|jgi:hypothetical protein|nr:hypothetical protein [Treponema sp.]